MTQRIRYQPTAEGTLKSTKVFPLGNMQLSVTLNIGTRSYFITDMTTMSTIKSGHGFRSLHELKKAAKVAMTDIGVSFGEEERNTDEH